MKNRQTILLQTDFSVNSLNLFIKTLESSQLTEPTSVVMGYGMWPPDSIVDLLFHSREKQLRELMTASYKEALNVIYNRYGESVSMVRFEQFTGFNQAAFSNYLKGLEIDQAFVDPNFKYQLPHSRSFDLTPFILKADIKLTTISAGQVINGFDPVQISWNI